MGLKSQNVAKEKVCFVPVSTSVYNQSSPLLTWRDKEETWGLAGCGEGTPVPGWEEGKGFGSQADEEGVGAEAVVAMVAVVGPGHMRRGGRTAGGVWGQVVLGEQS